jgi:transcriptional regulator of acetoin/glycerol metabolism
MEPSNTATAVEITALQVATLDEVVRDHILRVLAAHGNHKARTAQALGIDRTTLWKKLREYGQP